MDLLCFCILLLSANDADYKIWDLNTTDIA